jgi:hypothetical protein
VIEGVFYTARLLRTNGSGPSSLDWRKGNQTATNPTNVRQAVSTSFTYFKGASNSNGGDDADETENVQMGLGQTGTGGRDLHCSEMWASVIHVPPAGPGDVNRYGRPFGHIGAVQMRQLLAT